MSQKTSRPPVITIMGHVDHGKTTLLDHIRQTKTVAREAGGITQHIGAYSIDYQGKPLTFIDTPGHAAFGKMRARGALVTDLVVLVVAANDGVKPQTIESIRHIKNSNIPVIVAINKIDLKNIDPSIAKSGLAEHDLVVTEYGGDVEVVEISALKGKNVDKLLQTLVVMADLLELEAQPDAPLEAVVIESSLDKSRGSVASVIVKNGTLALRQNLVVEGITGRVKQLTNEDGANLDLVKPGFPAQVVGLESVPPVGAVVHDADNLPDQDQQDQKNQPFKEDQALEQDAPPTQDSESHDDSYSWEAELEELIEADDKPKLKLIVKADVEGTLEAILQNLDDDSVELLRAEVGEVVERDVELAETSGALVVAFHTKVPNKIKRLAKSAGVVIRAYDVIYKLIEDLQKKMLKLLEPTIDEVQTGEAEILEIFEIKGEKIAGCRVKTGEIKKTDKLHLKRGEEIIADPVIKSMMHGKQEVDKTTAKSECGLTFKNKKLDFQKGDRLIAYVVEDEE